MVRGNEEQPESVCEFSIYCLQPLHRSCEVCYHLKGGQDLSNCFTKLLTWQTSSDVLFHLD